MKRIILVAVLMGLVAAGILGQENKQGYWNTLSQNDKYGAILDYFSGWNDCANVLIKAGIKNDYIELVNGKWVSVIKSPDYIIPSLVKFFDNFYSDEKNYFLSMDKALMEFKILPLK